MTLPTNPAPSLPLPGPGTALPWAVVPGSLGTIEAADGTCVAQAQQVHGIDRERKEHHASRLANAAYIVAAANAHPALCARVVALEAALRELLEAAGEVDDATPLIEPGDSRPWEKLVRAMLRANVALGELNESATPVSKQP